MIDLLLYVLAGLVLVLGGVAAWAYSKYRRLRDIDRRARTASERQLAETQAAHEVARKTLVAELDKKRAQYNEARDKFYKIKAAYLALKQDQPAPDDGDLALAVRERDAFEADLIAARQQLADHEARAAEVARFDGRLWLRPPTRPVPPFRPRAERKTVIIAVLNLKGGVGKTTLTANLAATLAADGRPALMIDLDYQRSLSMLLLTDKDRKFRHRSGLSVQHFLRGEKHTAAELLRMTDEQAMPVPRCCLVPNSTAAAEESLDEVETRLMVAWLTDPKRPDPRFFLREALHDPALGDHFGYVLLDCPPRLTTACVNALAACDYVLVPVVPDPVSTHAAENLLRTLSLFKPLLPDLRILGVVPNMVRLHSGKPIQAHRDALTALKEALPAVWPETVRGDGRGHQARHGIRPGGGPTGYGRRGPPGRRRRGDRGRLPDARPRTRKGHRRPCASPHSACS